MSVAPGHTSEHVQNTNQFDRRGGISGRIQNRSRVQICISPCSVLKCIIRTTLYNKPNHLLCLNITRSTVQGPHTMFFKQLEQGRRLRVFRVYLSSLFVICFATSVLRNARCRSSELHKAKHVLHFSLPLTLSGFFCVFRHM